MNFIWIIFGFIAILVLVFSLFLISTHKRQLNELKTKTDFAIGGDEIMKVEMNGNAALEQVASNFNTLIKKYKSLKSELIQLEKKGQVDEGLASKIKNMELSLSQITLLTDIGRQITSTLNIEDILDRALQFIKSSMDFEEMELFYFQQGESKYKSIDKLGKIRTHQIDNDKKDHYLMNWSLRNNKDILLGDALLDYAQYVYEPIVSFSGKKPSSVICVPMFLHEREIGAIGVFSMQKESYNTYHLDFVKSLASYIAVAIDNSNMYVILESNKKEIELQKEKSDTLLLNILPEEVAEELKEKGHADAKSFDNVTVLFTDFVNFTGISEKLTPEQLVQEIDTCFQAFDKIIDQYGLEKIKTIGDAYLAVSGLPNPNPNHALQAVKAAMAMRTFIDERVGKKETQLSEVRIGLNSGSVVAGIVGLKKFAYDIWGDTVNTAARMEQSGEAGKINISGATYALIKDKFSCEYRGKVTAKNKGEVDMYFVENK